MLFLIISFLLVIDAAESNGWFSRIGWFSLAVVLGALGFIVLLSDKPLVIQWLLAWMTRP